MNALKIVVAVVGLIAVVAFALGPSLGLNVTPQSVLDFFVNAITGIVNFFEKFLEGLLG